MMKYYYLVLIFVCFACKNDSKNTKSLSENLKLSKVEVDLQEIKERGKLRAITTYSGTTFFLYRGRTMGFEYELLTRLADYLEVELEVVIARNEDELMEMLLAGEGDLIAYGYTILPSRKEYIEFTNPLYFSNQVLVQRKPDNWRRMKLHQIKNRLITDPIQLIGDTVSVKKNSSYAERMKSLSQEIGGEIVIDTIPGTKTTEEIIKMVVDGKIKYTVVDQNIANINASYYPILDANTQVSFSQQIGWGVRKNSPVLLEAVNTWIDEFKKEVDFHVIFNKYYKNKRKYKARVKSEFYSINDEKISPYDDMIKKYAEEIGWDWRLLASLTFQESKFQAQSESWAGARGLMQIMPETAKELNINPNDPYESVKGGTYYLKQLWEKNDDIQDSIQRIKFTLAAYNCGYAHLKDAQRIAKLKDRDPLVWDDNVELSILDLSQPEYYNLPEMRYGYVRGIEPYNYVKQIFKRYEHYKKFIEE
ncbi:MltF family protein [Psychroflexus maritimus]|nr:transporter substrate-binding domain-containing protein [Psychroflexus maritimus]